MTSRKDRLKKLLTVQEKLKAFHETRHAGFVAAARKAGAEAEEIGRRADSEDSLSSVFPDLYQRRMEQALVRQKREEHKAKREAGQVAMATARTNMVERSWRQEQRRDEREAGDRERLEIIERAARGRK